MKILFVTHSAPSPPTTGGHQRTALLVSALERCGDVSILFLGDPNERVKIREAGYHVLEHNIVADSQRERTGGSFRNAIHKTVDITRQIPIFRYAKNRSEFLKIKNIFENDNYDLIVGRYLSYSCKSGVFDIHPNIVDIDDIDTVKFANLLKGQKFSLLPSFAQKIFICVVNNFERRVIRKFDHALVASTDDVKYLPDISCSVFPNIPYNKTSKYTRSAKNGNILFVGSLDYWPNREGLFTFLREVWPKMLLAGVSNRLRIVGRGLSDSDAGWITRLPNVEYAGFVESLEVEYQQAVLTVVPVWHGAGTKIKILESLAHGRLSVVCEAAAHGIRELRVNAKTPLVTNTFDEFCSSINFLINNDKHRHDDEINLKNIIDETYNIKKLNTIIENALIKVI